MFLKVIVNVIKTYIALIEQNLEPCAYHSSWNSISQLWAAGLLAQSSLRSVFFYFAFLVQNFLDVFSGEKFLYLTSWMTFASTKSTSPGSISALILATVSLIQPNYYFSRWSMVSRTLRIVLSFICFSEEIGKGEYIKFSLATHPCLGDQHDKILNLVCSHVSSDEFMDSVAEITNSNYRISSLASAALAVLANSSPINSNAHFQDAEYNLKVLSGEISDNSRTLRIIQSLAAIIFSSLSIHLFIDTSFMSSVGFNEADSSSEQCLNESIYKYFLSEVEIDVSLLVSRILRVLDSLSSDAFLMGLSSGHSEIFNSIKYALSKAETPWDIGAALRMIEMHIRRESFAIMFSQFWEIARLGFLCVLKHIELSHLQPIKMFQRRVYELDHDESGHTTRGHLCIDDRDREEAAASGSDLLFGELLTDGVAKALDHMHLDVSQATTLCDLGMGIGKLAIQSWISHKSLKYVLGVELARTRYEIGEKALLNMVEMYPDAFKLKFREYFDPKKLRIAIEDRNGRVLEFRKQNLFLVQDEGFKGGLSADIIITETHFPEETTIRLCKHLSKMKSGARLLTYENLHECYNSSKVGITMPFKQLEINRSNEDKFPTTWSTVKGHHFYLWRKE